MGEGPDIGRDCSLGYTGSLHDNGTVAMEQLKKRFGDRAITHPAILTCSSDPSSVRGHLRIAIRFDDATIPHNGGRTCPNELLWTSKCGSTIRSRSEDSPSNHSVMHWLPQWLRSHKSITILWWATTTGDPPMTQHDCVPNLRRSNRCKLDGPNVITETGEGTKISMTGDWIYESITYLRSRRNMHRLSRNQMEHATVKTKQQIERMRIWGVDEFKLGDTHLYTISLTMCIVCAKIDGTRFELIDLHSHNSRGPNEYRPDQKSCMVQSCLYGIAWFPWLIPDLGIMTTYVVILEPWRRISLWKCRSLPIGAL
jgi:hypothetical protein